MVRNSANIGETSGIFVFLSLLLLCQLAWAEEKKTPIVAVFDIDDQGAGTKKRILKKLNEYLGAKLAEGGYKVIPRSQIREKLTDKKKESYKAVELPRDNMVQAVIEFLGT